MYPTTLRGEGYATLARVPMRASGSRRSPPHQLCRLPPLLTLQRVEVRRGMVAVVHGDHYPEEATDF